MIANRAGNIFSDMQYMLKLSRIVQNGIKGFHTSFFLLHDPTLKKKKVVVNQKTDKKREKQEAKRRLEPIIIPMDPDSVADPALFENSRKRTPVNFTAEEMEARVHLSKEWTRNCLANHRNELEKLQIKARSRQDALRELKKVSIDLYQQAIIVNNKLFPLTLIGPVDTPPLSDYIPPDLDDVPGKKVK